MMALALNGLHTKGWEQEWPAKYDLEILVKIRLLPLKDVMF